MTLKDICVLSVVTCARDTRVPEAARLMRQHHTGTLVVLDDLDGDRAPAGIVTDRDLVVEVLAGELDPAVTTVSAIMSSRLVVGAASESIDDAVARMRQHGVRRLPVIENDGRLLGIVTLDDLLELHAARGAELAAIVSKEQDREQRTRR